VTEHECSAPWNRAFCVTCGKVVHRDVLDSVKAMGAVGVKHSTNPNVQQWLATGDAEAAFGGKHKRRSGNTWKTA
jgi:hypothetical protein